MVDDFPSNVATSHLKLNRFKHSCTRITSRAVLLHIAHIPGKPSQSLNSYRRPVLVLSTISSAGFPTASSESTRICSSLWQRH